MSSLHWEFPCTVQAFSLNITPFSYVNFIHKHNFAVKEVHDKTQAVLRKQPEIRVFSSPIRVVDIATGGVAKIQIFSNPGRFRTTICAPWFPPLRRYGRLLNLTQAQSLEC